MRAKSNGESKGSVALPAILCAFLWGSAYPAVKLSYQLFALPAGDIPSRILLSGYRFTLAGAGMLAYSLLRGQSIRLKKAQLAPVSLLAIVQTVIQYSLYYIGLMHTTAAKASLINQSSNFMLVLAAGWFYTEDKLSPRKILGIALGFLGVAVINMGSGGAFSLMGEGLVFFSAISATAGYLIGKKYARQTSPVVLTGWQQLLGGLMLLTIGLCCKGRLVQISGEALLSLLYLSVTVAAAYAIWTRLISQNEVARVTSYKFLVPIFGMACSALLLGEQVWTVNHLLSLLLVTAGILVINGRAGHANVTEGKPGCQKSTR